MHRVNERTTHLINEVELKFDLFPLPISQTYHCRYDVYLDVQLKPATSLFLSSFIRIKMHKYIHTQQQFFRSSFFTLLMRHLLERLLDSVIVFSRLQID